MEYYLKSKKYDSLSAETKEKIKQEKLSQEKKDAAYRRKQPISAVDTCYMCDTQYNICIKHICNGISYNGNGNKSNFDYNF